MGIFFAIYLLVTVVSYMQTFANTLEVTKEKPMDMELLLYLRNRS